MQTLCANCHALKTQINGDWRTPKQQALHDAQGDCRVLDIAVESGRPVEVLKRQIERLHDVQSVQLKTAARQPVKNVGLRSSMGRQR